MKGQELGSLQDQPEQLKMRGIILYCAWDYVLKCPKKDIKK